MPPEATVPYLQAYGNITKVVDVEAALNDAAQQELIASEHRLVSVNPPSWLHLPERKQAQVLAPKPSFEKLD